VLGLTFAETSGSKDALGDCKYETTATCSALWRL
jgi:hypothetical protein